MKIRNVTFSAKQLLCLAIYYGIATHLPDSYSFFGGKFANRIRVALCKHIFLRCGSIKTINRKVSFGSGRGVEIGDGSGIGANTTIPSKIIIGNNVILSRNCFILNRNHNYENTNIPIVEQGFKEIKLTVIEDDCWIGMNTLMTPGRHVSKGTIVAMGSVLTKDFPTYSIVGGNPAIFIKSRL
ncbi:MAG: acyltransferase [Alistipes sp.]|nr:acyltransferase [Alistipes sp.]